MRAALREMIRVLVLGSSGQVGRSLSALTWPADMDVVFCRRDRVNLAQPDSIAEEMLSGRYDIVVNAAAWTDVEGAEDHEAEAFRANADGPASLAKLCAEEGACLLHLSTDYVFDGSACGDHDEDHPIHPLGVYARSKAAGEEGVRAALDRHVILRTAWVYSPFGKNFVTTMLRLGAERDELKVVDDQMGNPTPAGAIALAILAIAARVKERQAIWGTYHFAGRPWTTWHGLADAVFDAAAPIWGRRPALQPILAREWPSKVDRPQNTRLDCSRIERDYGIVAPYWRVDVTSLVAELLRVTSASDPLTNGKPERSQ